MRVRVYRNLHKNVWSVVKVSTGRVAFHADSLTLTDVQWRVQPAGNALVRKCGRKNVHAYAVGELETLLPTNTLGHRVRYNPHLMTTFETAQGHTVTQSERAEFTGTGYAYIPCWDGCEGKR
jgi:hypothetical protein